MATSFEALSCAWVEDKKNYVKLSTMCAYQTILRTHIIPYFKETNMITEIGVQSFVLSKLSAGMSQKSVKDMLVVLKMIGKYAQKKKLMEVELMDIAFPPNENPKKFEVMNRQDEKKLISYLSENFSFENLGMLICLGTGMRIGEICGLRWGDINLDNAEIGVNRTVERIYLNSPNEKTRLIIEEPKTVNSKRKIPLNNSLLKIVKPLKKVVNNSFYIVTNSETPMEPRIYRKRFEKVLEKLDITKLRFHGLRHTFATRCIEASNDYKTVSAILGHASITTTLNLYVHPNSEQKKKCIEKMLKSL
jgi:integrase